MDNISTFKYRVANSTIGFDHLFDVLANSFQTPSQSFPPYNIVKLDDQTYQIELAVAGFSHDDLDVQIQENVLTITGSKRNTDAHNYLHKGIAARDFTSKFTVADDVEISNASMVNGLLVMTLQRHIPEHKKPRKIAIGGVTQASQLLTEH